MTVERMLEIARQHSGCANDAVLAMVEERHREAHGVTLSEALRREQARKQAAQWWPRLVTDGAEPQP